MNLAFASFAVFAAVFGLCGDPAPVKDTPTAADVVARFKQDGMPVAGQVDYNESTDPEHLLGRPGQYISKTNFHDGRIFAITLLGIDVQHGGSVEVFETEELATKRRKFLEDLTKILPFLVEYDYQEGPIVLRLARQLTPQQAEAYLESLRAGKPE